MSYDISFKAKLEGMDRYISIKVDVANITWNVREIIVKSTGLEWKNEANNGPCAEVIPKIEAGLMELVEHGDKYKQYEAPNGWGTVKGTINFFSKIICAWNELVQEDEELAMAATFWIE